MTDDERSDSERIHFLSRTHMLDFTRNGRAYIFENFEARSAVQARAFLEGYNYSINRIDHGVFNSDSTTLYAIRRHYNTKRLWVALAFTFGIFGVALYAMGTNDIGSASASWRGMRITLENVGPGLILIVCALAASVVGATQSKLKITRVLGKTETIELKASQPTPVPRFPETETVLAGSSRECRLFRDLSIYLGKATLAFAVLNSKGQVDIESMGWSAVPADIQRQAVKEASNWMVLDTSDQWSGSMGEWSLQRKTIKFFEGDKTWCIVGMTSRNTDKQREIARKDTSPIFSIQN